MSKNEQLQTFAREAERVEAEVLALLEGFRELLAADEAQTDEMAHDDLLAEAESYLYDALDALADFRESCADARSGQDA